MLSALEGWFGRMLMLSAAASVGRGEGKPTIKADLFAGMWEQVAAVGE
ncbi:hypothetical protein [Saccharibacillus deserti]|nr:hypothetical protein [Saccharibacillus deserti]